MYIFLSLTSWVLLCTFSDWLLFFEGCFVALFDGVCSFCFRLKCCSCCEVWWTFSMQFLCWCYKTLLRLLSGFLNWFCFEMVSKTIVWVSINDFISLSLIIVLTIKSWYYFLPYWYFYDHFVSNNWTLYSNFPKFFQSSVLRQIFHTLRN